MSLRSQDYAELSDYGYKAPGVDYALHDKDKVVIGGVTYKVVEHMDRPSGYQGTIYQCVDTGEIVAVHRGTEFGKGLKAAIQDGVIADGGMVAGRVNSQAADAIELTKHALDFAQQYAARNSSIPVPVVTVTGHSQGGTLAQITAHHFNLHGETFNAYGAASLDRRIPEGGNHVINHVMAGDAVSAASPHYGQVRIYATRHDIDVLTGHGYSKEYSLSGGRGPLGAAKDLVDDHSLSNFLNRDSDGMPHRSVLRDPQARLFAQQDMDMIAAYRHDVQAWRLGITVGTRGLQGLVEDTIDAARGPLAAGEPAQHALSKGEAARAATLEQARQMLTPLAATASDPRLDATTVDIWATHLRSPDRTPETTGVAPAAVASTLPLAPDAVRALQQNLHALGITDHRGQPMSVSGIYDAPTRFAVMGFQHDHDLLATGIADPATLALVSAHARIAELRAVQPTARDVKAEVSNAIRTPMAPPAMTAAPSESVMAPTAMLRPFSEPTHPQHGIYAELEKLLPAGTSPERLAQATATCHQAGIDKPQDLASIIGSGNAILFTSRSLVCRIGEMDMGQPAPSIQQTMQQVEQFDQQREQHHAQFQAQQAQINAQAQQGPVLGGR